MSEKMKLWRTDEDGVSRLLGIPVGLPWKHSEDLPLRYFEPENPSLFVSRTVGMGWDLNLGAVAVKLGLIRPDDSLPDMEEFIPAGWRRALRTGALLGLGATAGVCGLVARHSRVVSKWSLSGVPTRYASGKTMAGLLLGVAAAPLVLSHVPDGIALLHGEKPSPAPASADVATSAQALGVQTLTVLGGIATLVETKHRGKKQPLVVLAAVAAPLVSGGVVVATIKTALGNIQEFLRRQQA